MTPPRALRRPPRRTARLATAALAAVAVLVGLLVPGAAVAAPEPSPTPSPTQTPAVPPGTTLFTLSPLSNGIVRPGDALNVSISVQNGTAADLPGTTVTLSLGTDPIADREDLGEWLGGTAEAAGMQPVASAVFDAVAAGAFQVRGMTVPADDPALQGRAPGVYPLEATYEGESGTVRSTSAMIVPADDVTDVGLGVVVPITAGPRAAGLLTSDELAALTAPDGDLTNQLDSVTGTSAILAVDPAIPAAIRVLGASAPESAVEWLARLETMQNSRFALQFGDADVTAQLQAGVPRPLQPTSFTAYMEPSDFESATPEPTPTPTPTSAPQTVLPTTEQLLAVGPATRNGVYWPADGTADADVVTQLAGLPADGTPPVTLVPSATTEAGAAGRTVPAHGRGGDAGVLVYDSDVSDALDRASRSEESWLRGNPLTAATAYLSFATADAQGPLLVTVGRGDGRTRVELGAAISAAFSAPNVLPRTLAAIAASEAAEVKLADVSEPPERVDAASTLMGQEAELARFATILDDPTLLTGPERAEILQLLGVAWIDDDTWPAALAAHRDQTAATLGSVALLPTSPSDLYGSSAALRFWVRNDLPYPVNLVLYTTRDNLRLDVQGETPVVATPESNTRVEVPVQARVGRGDVTLTLQLRSPAFVAIGQPETVDVNVWADWEAVGIVALAVLVGALLIVGVVRTVLRMRRRRRGTDAATPADDAGSDDRSDRGGDGDRDTTGSEQR
ncbi:DUF6049 family protein [Microbacterium timonense]|uniref:DUF6049 family protein n=1 Tax=Microbacterium timonense TaxID=2086576 RepID=UPI001356EE58|nr:DUF6049 family protein [Microbacterium timonense]